MGRSSPDFQVVVTQCFDLNPLILPFPRPYLELVVHRGSERPRRPESRLVQDCKCFCPGREKFFFCAIRLGGLQQQVELICRRFESRSFLNLNPQRLHLFQVLRFMFQACLNPSAQMLVSQIWQGRPQTLLPAGSESAQFLLFAQPRLILLWSLKVPPPSDTELRRSIAGGPSSNSPRHSVGFPTTREINPGD
jgi:hypothetical protein